MAPMSAASRPTLRALVAGLAALTLVLGACSSDDDADATVVEQDDATTTEATSDGSEPDEGDDTDATEPDDAGDEITVDDLRPLLPTATDIGPDYSVDDDGDDADEDDEENPLDEACPAVAGLAENDDTQIVTASFSAEDERSVEVDLNAAPAATDADGFDERIDALNSCGTVSFSEGGFDYEVTATAERDDSLGDVGAVITGDVTISSPQLDQPVTLVIRQHVFLVGRLGASIEVTSGVVQTGPATLEPVPGDVEVIDTLGPQLATALADLQG